MWGDHTGLPVACVKIDKASAPESPALGEIYERRLVTLPQIPEPSTEHRDGIVGTGSVTLSVDNSDGLLNGRDITGWNVSISLLDGKGVLTARFEGRIDEWTLGGIKCELTVKSHEAIALSAELPKRTLNDVIEAEKSAGRTDGLISENLSKPIPIVFGRVVKMPLLLIRSDDVNREYHYIVGEGQGLNGKSFKGVYTVYRDKLALDSIEGVVGGGARNASLTLEDGDRRTEEWYKNWWVEITLGTGAGQIRRVESYNSASNEVAVADEWNPAPDAASEYRLREWRFYDGGQTNYYPGYAWIRLKKRFGDKGVQFYADVSGLQDEVNPMNAVKSILQSSAWGLGEKAVFNEDGVRSSPLRCEGALITKTSARDVISGILRMGGMMIMRNAGRLSIVDDEDRGVGMGESLEISDLVERSPQVKYARIEDRVRSLKIRYRKDHSENDAYCCELTRQSSPEGVDETLDARWIYEHETADRVLDYMRKKIALASRKLAVTIGKEQSEGEVGSVWKISIPHLGIEEEAWEVTDSTHVVAGERTVSFIPYSDTPYNYEPITDEGGTLPDDVDGVEPDYENTPPDPVANLTVSIIANYANLQWNSPEDNYGGAVVSVKESDEDVSEYREEVTVKGGSARVRGLTSGKSYDFMVISLNQTGEIKGLPVFRVGHTVV